jgi:hypothetical protein
MLLFNLLFLIAPFIPKVSLTRTFNPAYWISILLILIQLTGMKQTYGDFTLSYIDKITWYNYLGAKAEALKSKADVTNTDVYKINQKRMARLSNLSWSKKAKVSKEDFNTQLFYNTKAVFEAYVENIIENINSQSLGIVRNINKAHLQSKIKNLANLSMYQNRMYSALFFFTLMLMVLNYKKQHYIEFMIIIVIGYNLITSGISFWQGDRFSLVLYPTILCFFFYQLKKTPIQKYI